MAKRAVDVAVTLRRALRFTLRQFDNGPAAPAPATAAAAGSARCPRVPPPHAAESATAAAVVGGDEAPNAAVVAGLLADEPVVVHPDTHPDDVLAIMVGDAVRSGKATFAIPLEMLATATPAAAPAPAPSRLARSLQTAADDDDDSGNDDNAGGGGGEGGAGDGLLSIIAPDAAALSGVGGAHAALRSRSLSAREAAAVALWPRDLSRADFHEQQHERQGRAPQQEKQEEGRGGSGAGADGGTVQPVDDVITKQCIALATECRAGDLRRLAEGAAVNLASLRCGDEQATLLHHAAAFALPVSSPSSSSSQALQDMLHLLVDTHGVAVDAGTRNGATALHWAAGHGNVEAVAALLGAGADPLARTWTWDRSVFGRGSGQTPLHWAAESGHAAVVDLLLRHTAPPPRTATANDGGQQRPPASPGGGGGGRDHGGGDGNDHAAGQQRWRTSAGDDVLMAAVPDERGQTPADVAGHNLQWGVHAALRALEDRRYVVVDVETIAPPPAEQ